ncbi:MAG: DUF2341 domain-containing protein [Bacteroidota bacterium]|nr:DUF2341 domain-containing protein [Bacteroidota bacterium]MDP3147258.1 DUF2341 domain-containing protein [Bacteroidota bacterium]MDP3557368.1 DUF2341 domain-containing protein [Bacteroidota bacterium]
MKSKITFLMMALAFVFSNAKAQLPGYSNVESITVNNTSTTTAIDYQLRLVINTQTLISATQMLATGDDIRFGKTCNGSTLYNYWIESGINTATTIIWVKIDTIAASGSRTFYMYHGNPTAIATSSIPLVFPFAGSSTDSVSTGGAGGATLSQRGFRFSPNVDILVTSLGKREPTGTVRYVTLFDNTTQAIITQQQVSGPLGVYSYTSLPNPIWLTQNTQYIIQLYQGSSDGYYFGTSSQIDSRLTYYDMRYCNSCTQNTFPTNVLTNYHYGYADFLFYYRNMITPAPTYTLNGSSVTVPVITGPSGLCSGSSINLTATGATTYSWSTGATTSSIAPTPTANTSYTVTGSNTLTCMSGMAVHSVTVNPLPTVTAISSTSILCVGQTASITASGADTYTWNTASNNTIIAVSPSVTTSYSVTGTDVNGCSNTFTISQSVSPCTGIMSKTSTINGLLIYPNPNTGLFTIDLNNNFIKTIEIMDVTGRILLTKTSSNEKIDFNINALVNGIYYVKIQSNNSVEVIKIVKE